MTTWWTHANNDHTALANCSTNHCGCEFINKTSRTCASRPVSSAKLLLAGAGFLEGIMTKAEVEKRRAELLAQVREFVKKEGQ